MGTGSEIDPNGNYVMRGGEWENVENVELQVGTSS